MPRYQPDLHKVTVNTWNTKDQTGNGLDTFMDQRLFGGNVGHASIEMTLPQDDATRKLIETWCMDETFETYKKDFSAEEQGTVTFEQYLEKGKRRIPVRLVEHTTPLLRTTEQGRLEESKGETAAKTGYYKIDFSFWHGQDLAGLQTFSLSNKEKDMVNERQAHHFEYSDRARETFQPEERIHRGKIGSQRMTYAPEVIVHAGSGDPKEIARASELEQINKALKTIALIEEKLTDENFKIGITDTLALMCKNVGLPIEPMQEFMKTNKEGDYDERLTAFRKFFIQKVKIHETALGKRKDDLLSGLKLEALVTPEHITRGLPPDHRVELPLVTDSERGFEPEAMLKKMRELTDPGADEFNLHTKNCSKTTTAVLRAGAEHDPLLARTAGLEVMGYLSTPQQVLGNAQRARDAIATDRQNTLYTRVAESEVLNRAMGGFVATWLNKDSTTLQQAGALGGMIAIGALKTPAALVRTLANPSQSMSNLAAGVGTAFNKANLPMKAVVGLASIIPMVALAPFALVEKGLQGLAAPFRAVAGFISKKPPSAKTDNEITTPLPSQNREAGPESASSYSKLAKLVDSKVAGKIQAATMETSVKKRSAVDILDQFEADLKNTTDKVVTLSAKDFDKVNSYVRKAEDPELTAKFQKCCETSLKRANQLSPHKPSDVEEIVREVDESQIAGRP